MKKYIPLHIYKNKGESWSNGGLSDKYNECYIECPDGFLTEDMIKEDAIVRLEAGAFGTIKLVPIKPVPENHVGYMMGGCYVATSDGRLNRLIEKTFGCHFYGAIALHDRTETWEDYDLLTR